MKGVCVWAGSWASGTVATAVAPAGVYCDLPPGLVVSSHSWLCRFSKKLLSHLTGSLVQAPSRALVTVSLAMPEPAPLVQPKPCSSMEAPSGSGPTRSSVWAPCALPKVWPPAMSATVSSSFMAMRLNVWRM